MSDSDVFKDRHLYEDEEVIEKTINYLRLNDPENANRDYAIGFLKFMQRFAFVAVQRFAFVAEKSEGFDFDKFFDKYKKSQEQSTENG